MESFNEIVVKQYDCVISIIMPVYNASKTLNIPVESLKIQSYKNLQVIFVNDCSTDDSLEIIQQYAYELEAIGMQVVITSHAHNQGVAAARNTGLSLSSGEYIYYLDSDDFLEINAIELMIKTALNNKADIVSCNWFLAFKQNKRLMAQPRFTTAWEAIELMLSGLMRWNLWLFMVKRSLYESNQIRFESGMNMGEDLMVTLKLFSHAQKVSYVDSALYNYNQMNENSLTKNYSDKNIEEVTWNVLEAERYLKLSKYNTQLGNLIDFLKLNIKLPLLISNKVSNYKKWLNWFPESNANVSDNKLLSIRLYVLQKMALQSQYWFIKLHYYLIIKVVYGILYK